MPINFEVHIFFTLDTNEEGNDDKDQKIIMNKRRVKMQTS